MINGESFGPGRPRGQANDHGRVSTYELQVSEICGKFYMERRKRKPMTRKCRASRSPSISNARSGTPLVFRDPPSSDAADFAGY